jgi:hypothetical protein
LQTAGLSLDAEPTSAPDREDVVVDGVGAVICTSLMRRLARLVMGHALQEWVIVSVCRSAGREIG